MYQPGNPLIFSSGLFFLLFTVLYGGYLLLHRHHDARILYLTIFSIFFYYKSSGEYVGLLFISMFMDYGLGAWIHVTKGKFARKMLMVLSVTVNLGMLAYFKYTNFFLESFAWATGGPFKPLDIFLPAGISFFTFQSLSYTIDIYRGTLKPVKSFLDYAFFVTFFPQLVAGPIVRAAEFIPQIRKEIHVSNEALARAMFLIISGLFKKAIISDYISINFVDRIFDNPTLYSGFENMMGVYGYTLQIYCDFSGYSDIAIGIALLLGYTLPENFRAPYQSVSVQEFWRRWHISLSTWLRDYLYIGLGGNRKGSFRTYFNLFMTMLLGGLWHGANWVFILWGALHGLALAIDRFFTGLGRMFSNPAARSLLVMAVLHGSAAGLTWWASENAWIQPTHVQAFYQFNGLLMAVWTALWLVGTLVDTAIRRIMRNDVWPVSRFAALLMVFHFVAFCWIFFRAGAPGNPTPMKTSYEVLLQMAASFHPQLAGQVLWGYKEVFALMLIGYVLHLIPERLDGWVQRGFARVPWPVLSLLLAAVILFYLQIRSSEVQPFIYFQF